MRDKLIEVLGRFPVWHSTLKERWMPEAVEKLADYLLANGVVVVDTDIISAENRPLISTIADYPIDEVISLMKAKEEGRIIVPPCKVGQMVYYLATECDGCEERESYCHRDCKKPTGFTKVNCTTIKQFMIFGNQFDAMTDTEAFGSTHCHHFYFRNIGKTVFLTKEEAEQALKGR